jgi:hypothetical protein
MLSRKKWLWISLLGISLLLLLSFRPIVWGFYGHRLINRMAIFTLPVPLFGFYKTHMAYVQEHAVDPDKRRYASPIEAGRHYIDLDHWSSGDSMILKEPFLDVLITFGRIKLVDKATLQEVSSYDGLDSTRRIPDEILLNYQLIRDTLSSRLYDLIGDGQVTFETEEWSISITDQFALHGYLPYHLLFYQNSLVKAFKNQEFNQILRISAELGHYVADAHVPLHTTENYNGQLTGQDGIHAFWETRIPELFAELEYDFFTGKSDYINDKEDFFWSIIDESHSRVNEVLMIEKQLRSEFAADRQFCFDNRNGQVLRTQCAEFAKAYQDAMQGMVARRMTQAVKAIGSCWYTAWVDAGSPSLDPLSRTGVIEIPISIDTLIESDHILRSEKNNEND